MQEPQSPKGASLSSTHPSKRRQKHTVFSIEQRLQLEEFFRRKHYRTYDERETLANKLDLQEQQVQVWLRNRRTKERRLQRLGGQQGQRAQAAPQGRSIWAAAPALVPAGPEFQRAPEFLSTPVFPEDPVSSTNHVAPAGSLHYGGSGFCSPPPPSPLKSPQKQNPLSLATARPAGTLHRATKVRPCCTSSSSSSSSSSS